MSAHEDLSRGSAVQASSDRTFGLAMSGFFLLAALLPSMRGRPVRPWPALASAAFLAAALLRPSLLGPLNRAWTALAMLLHRIVSPLAMGALFFLVITPLALGMRLFGRDALRLRLDAAAETYWRKREPPGPAPRDMIHQF
jgi:Saxitoxin biosynthesis operon protein SxtJ